MLTPAESAHARMLAQAQSEGRITTHLKDVEVDSRKASGYHEVAAAKSVRVRREGRSRGFSETRFKGSPE